MSFQHSSASKYCGRMRILRKHKFYSKITIIYTWHYFGLNFDIILTLIGKHITLIQRIDGKVVFMLLRASSLVFVVAAADDNDTSNCRF